MVVNQKISKSISDIDLFFKLPYHFYVGMDILKSVSNEPIAIDIRYGFTFKNHALLLVELKKAKISLMQRQSELLKRRDYLYTSLSRARKQQTAKPSNELEKRIIDFKAEIDNINNLI